MSYFPLDEHISVYQISGKDNEQGFNITLAAKKVAVLFNLEHQTIVQGGPAQDPLSLEQGMMYLLYHPMTEVTLRFKLHPRSRLWVMIFSLEKIHEFFMGVGQQPDLFDAISINKKYYSAFPIKKPMYAVLEQMFFTPIPQNTQHLYIKGKVLEVFSLYFGEDDGIDTSGCPFLKDELNVQKVHKAKEIVTRNLVEPPTIKELCKLVGLNEYQLKAGFKRLYGSPIYQYLLDQRMQHARSLLLSGTYKVNEIAWEVGYTNPSHFIAAFKRKYLVTPKKFLMNIEHGGGPMEHA